MYSFWAIYLGHDVYLKSLLTWNQFREMSRRTVLAENLCSNTTGSLERLTRGNYQWPRIGNPSISVFDSCLTCLKNHEARQRNVEEGTAFTRFWFNSILFSTMTNELGKCPDSGDFIHSQYICIKHVVNPSVIHTIDKDLEGPDIIICPNCRTKCLTSNFSKAFKVVCPQQASVPNEVTLSTSVYI